MVSIALVCIYNGNQGDFDPHPMRESDNYHLVSMYVYMHLAFKELINIYYSIH